MSDTKERTKTIELADKITFDGREYPSITFRPPKVGERRLAESHLRNGQHPQAMTMFAVQLLGKCGGVPDAVIEQMYDDQFMEAFSFISDFSGRTVTQARA